MTRGGRLLATVLDSPGVRATEDRVAFDRLGGQGVDGGIAVPVVGVETLEDLVGQPHRAESVVTADTGSGPAANGLHEVFNLECQGLASGRLNLVHAQDLAKNVLFHRHGLAEIDFLQVKPAAEELVGRLHQGGGLGREIKRGVAFRASRSASCAWPYSWRGWP